MLRNQVDYKGRPCMDFGLSARKNRPRSDIINNDPGVNDSDEEDGLVFHKYSDSQAGPLYERTKNSLIVIVD